MAVITPDTFDPLRRFVSVRWAQGIPIVDAEVNESDDIRRFELRAYLKWFVGDGIPYGSDGFRIEAAAIPAANDFVIRAGVPAAPGGTDPLITGLRHVGRCLVDGLDATIEADVGFRAQTLHTSQAGAAALAAQAATVVVPELPVLDGSVLVFLDLWEWLLGPDDEPTLIFPDIGTETCSRLRRDWSVRARDAAAVPQPGDADHQVGHAYYALARIGRVAADPNVYPSQIEDLREQRLLTPPSTLIEDLLGTTPDRYRRGLDRPVISIRTAVNALLRGELPSTIDQVIAPDPANDFSTRAVLRTPTETFVLWHSDRAGGITQIFATRWPNDQPALAGTTPPIQITPGPAAANIPSAVLLPTLPTPSIFVAYQTQNDIRFRRAGDPAGLPAAAETSIAGQAESEGHPVVVIAGQVVTTFWYWNGPGVNDLIRYRRRLYTPAWDEAGAVWLDGETQQLSTLRPRAPSTVAGLFHAAADSANRIWIAFSTFGGNIAVARLTPASGAVETWTDLQLTSAGSDQQPFVLVDEPGFVWVFWRGDNGIYHQAFDLALGTWGVALLVPGTAGALDVSERPCATLDDEGGLWLLWTKDDGAGGTDVWTVRRDPGVGGWGEPRQVTAAPADNDFPVAFTEGGSIQLFYRSNRSGQFDLYFKQLITAMSALTRQLPEQPMPNPTIVPAWGADLTYTVTNSEFLAVDVRLSELDEEPAQIELTVPAGGTVHAVRDPASWSVAGTQLLGGGVWVAAPVALGNWTLTVSPGGAPTDPATIELSNPSGTGPTGLLRLVLRSIAVGACEVSPGGGTLSIDRLLAAPSIVNAQVTSGTPVKELDAVTLGATPQATQQVNPAPSVPLSALPAILASWAPEPDNALAVTAFASVGATASFTAPAAYADTNLGFRCTAVYDLNASGTVDASEPKTETVLAVAIETVTHGMLLVLDRSGSMASTLGGGITKWDATVQAAHAWIDLFRSFRSGAEHKAGIITFEHDPCWWTLSPSDDVTLRDPTSGAAATAMSGLAGLGDSTVLNLGSEQSCTPIGDALVKGLQVLQTALSPGDKASMVLLTDGYENSGNATIKLSAGPAPSTFAVERVKPANSFGNDLVADRLFTIGVGSSVDEDRLNDLPNPPGSGMGPGYYRLTTSAKEILPTFADMLGQVLDAQRVTPAAVADPAPVANGVYFEIPTGEQRVAILVPWTSATHNLRVAWRLQGSAGSFTQLAAADPSVVGYKRRQFHGLMAVDLTALSGNGTPPATQWRVQHVDGGDVAQPMSDADVLCMVDLVTKAEIRFDKPRYFLGDPIALHCSVRTGGRTVTGASVGVDAARPGEGLGTFLSTNAGTFKQILRGSSDQPSTSAGGTRVPPKPTGSDPDAPKGYMFKSLLKVKGIDALPVVTPPAFFLHDDGAHGDGAANDGDYANVFTDTTKEGTYTFRFRVEGTLPDGSRFSRLFVRSTWVGVRPDPSSSPVSWAQATGVPIGMLGQVLTITPKSAGGEYLGPFRADVISFHVSQGMLDGALVDNLDGSYSQRVLYKKGERPIVTPGVYDVPMRPTGPGTGDTGDGGGKDDCWDRLDDCDGEFCDYIHLMSRAILCLVKRILRAIERLFAK